MTPGGSDKSGVYKLKYKIEGEIFRHEFTDARHFLAALDRALETADGREVKLKKAYKRVGA